MPTTVQETTPMEIDELSQAANTATNNNDNNGTSTSVSAPRPVANTASLQLQQIKQHFNPEGMLKKSRSSSTFNSNQAENTRLISICGRTPHNYYTMISPIIYTM